MAVSYLDGSAFYPSAGKLEISNVQTAHFPAGKTPARSNRCPSDVEFDMNLGLQASLISQILCRLNCYGNKCMGRGDRQ